MRTVVNIEAVRWLSEIHAVTIWLAIRLIAEH